MPRIMVEIDGVSYTAILPEDWNRMNREYKRTVRRQSLQILWLRFRIVWVQFLILVNRVFTPDFLIALLVAAALLAYWIALYRLHIR
jgi:hypothetical protein